MLLTEILNKQMPWTVDKSTSNEQFIANFEINGIKYVYTAEFLPQYVAQHGDASFEFEDCWHIMFRNMSPNIPRGQMYRITNTGNAMSVFTTVVDITLEFMKEYKPHTMVMSADEPNRKSLYLKMIRKLLPNWSIGTFDADIVVYDPERV